MDRRKFVSLTVAAGAVAGVSSLLVSAGTSQELLQEKRYQKGKSPWPICLDTATIRPASLKDKVKIAAKTGYAAIEPWDGELQKFESEGGNLFSSNALHPHVSSSLSAVGGSYLRYIAPSNLEPIQNSTFQQL